MSSIPELRTTWERTFVADDGLADGLLATCTRRSIHSPHRWTHASALAAGNTERRVSHRRQPPDN